MVSFAQLRNLDTSKLTKAADTAVKVGKDMESRAGDVNDVAKRGGDGSDFWAGVDADAQNALLTTFPPPLNAAGTVFKSSAGTVDKLVDELDAAKNEIDTAISSYPRLIVGDDGSVTYPPTNSAEDAKQMQAQAQDLAAKLKAAVDRANAADTAASGELAQHDLGAGKPVQVKLPDGSYYLTTGDKDNEVKVKNDQNGNLIVTVDGEDFKYDKGTKLTLNTGDGEDNVDINEHVNNDINVSTGDGKDVVTDHDSKGQRTISTGAGDDTVAVTGQDRNIFTEAGDDKVTAIGDKNNVGTGDGNDDVKTTGGTAYAGDGDDKIRAGNHDDPLYKDADEHDTTIYGNDGDDEIQGSTKNDTISGGKGEDEIYGHEGDDVIAGNDDHDYIDGQDGNDKISGGGDKDVLYGLDGNDAIDGGAGRDYLEGGDDKDVLTGGAEEDVLSGGRGDDDLRGGDADDVTYAGEGKDTIDGGAGNDKSFVQDGDTVAKDKGDTVQKVDIADNSFIKIDGSDEFQDRIRADLDMYSSSPTGRQMIENLSDGVDNSRHDWMPGERELVINENDEDNGEAQPGLDGFLGHDVNININPEYDGSPYQHQLNSTPYEKVPAHTLYHELGHAYDFYNDTSLDGDYSDGSPRDERQAVGLPTVDHDNNPKTPDVVDPDHPKQYTENGLREEQGREPRPQY
ncbi:M91 family zinc metallopeptidase [Stackebrandtia nassauensis]|uniref:Hemolysin-type calcium-binding region n=1 Tax=Stackebrandtia nassauensis (strain DSM 44728 / CIP 108903 / NRRL B-16338 / NBRC 102104 / LLR-40K-21) TaxID=446470 RepID=D3Q5J4_STANL|nr:M91 family zinc metallopeptidase [Stackebrandtia nassauensis]ADD46054.1 hypothetical protein Snas_6438 [Stackebrandtia nassauensis DSM 44728]